MDPFSKLPPELREKVFIQSRCKTFIPQLIQASPIMLRQYISPKAYIQRTLLALDFDDDMVQDAMAIILSHSSNISGKYGKTVQKLLRSWAHNELPNPLQARDIRLLNLLDQLHTGLLFFIEDYLTKATATFQPREYLCLPDMLSIQNNLVFKARKVTTRFDSSRLTNSERKRLLRAFLNYEFQCKANHIKVLTEFERHAVNCVKIYMCSLYGAMFAQCGDSWLPETPSSPLSTIGLLYPDVFYINPDVFYINPDVYASDMGLSGEDHFGMVWNFMRSGLDLATIFLQFATGKVQEREHLKIWFTEFYKLGYYSFPFIHSFNEFVPKNRTEEVTQRDDPGMYQLLYPLFSSACAVRKKVYQQRAWLFFDDHRFYPSLGAPWSVFPEKVQIKEELAKLLWVEGWLGDPARTRALHRSQKWHDERLGKPSENSEIGEPHDSNLDETCQYSLPNVKGGIPNRELIPFWK
ncbi:hypothetical protein NW762_005557 [Fusarium torreyae]|uniref:Uncharacterized protein n=1 Tax=Fusarium torreyae TaxID=1237075 RepID=A0A9W8S1Z5_9HYPO|nr:hypothetical protein NW762_005557 [Fusarium torreyae]